MNLFEKVMAASRALDNNDLAQAANLVSEVESEIPSISDQVVLLNVLPNLGGVVIDLGTWTHDETLLTRGIRYTSYALTEIPENKLSVVYHYNVANGLSSLWHIRWQNSLPKGEIDDSHLHAKTHYRKAIDLALKWPDAVDTHLKSQLLVNFANCLDSIGRSVEAVRWYDEALTLNPLMGEALGNKGITLHHLAFLSHGRTHLFLLEAQRLLKTALENSRHPRMTVPFREHYDEITRVIQGHEFIHAEEDLPPQPKSAFQEFLIQFCVTHNLYLTPAVFVGSNQTVVYGDPMFINHMVAPIDDNSKFERYVTFLNQIKQDYILARYFLIQSQYRSETIDLIDRDVALYYPIDYSLDGAYIQLLKASMAAAVNVLDKIASFVHDYCRVSSIADRDVKFRNIWSMPRTPYVLRPELGAKKNLLLTALLDLSLDVRKGGYYERVYEYRNALTHRFLVVHDILISPQENSDIQRVVLDEFVQDCILAMQIARAAVMYLVMFVNVQEDRTEGNQPILPIPGIPLDDTLRWVPG
jgi:tetratricopeptide (TPR) repeat protein